MHSSVVPRRDTPGRPDWAGRSTLSSNSKTVAPTSRVAGAFRVNAFLVQLTNDNVHSGDIFHDAFHDGAHRARFDGAQTVARLNTLTQHLTTRTTTNI